MPPCLAFLLRGRSSAATTHGCHRCAHPQLRIALNLNLSRVAIDDEIMQLHVRLSGHILRVQHGIARQQRQPAAKRLQTNRARSYSRAAARVLMRMGESGSRCC